MFKLADKQWENICERVDTCALTGAAAFVASIPKAEILANGPLWCYFYALRHLEASEHSIAQRFHGSQPDNNAIVYGSEKYILAALQRLLAKETQPELLLIESSCSMSLIGDDLNGIAAKAAVPCPCVTMDCGGLVGGFAEGYVKAQLAVLEKLVDEAEEAQPNVINIIGQTDFYLNGRADSKEIRRLLELAGYKVQAMPGSGASIEQLKALGRASLNVVTQEELGLPVAQYLEQRLGTPYVLAGLPYGVEGTMSWLRRIAAVMPAANMSLVEEEAQKTQAFLHGQLNDARCQWGSLWYDRVIVSAPPTQALCLAQALRQEWLDTRQLVVCCQRALPSGKQELYCQEADSVYTAGVDKMSLERMVESGESLLILGSSSENALLHRLKHTFSSCTIASPVKEEVLLLEQPFVGITGSRYMLQRLWKCYIDACLQKQSE